MNQFLEVIFIRPGLLWINRTAYAVKETFRIRGPLVVAVIQICGVTLSLALLLGMAHGLARQHERDIEKSPSAREIAVVASRTSQSFSQPLINELEAQPGIQLVIEDISKVVSLKGTTAERTGVTVRCTKPGDPLLAFYGADVLKPGRKEIVINAALADAVGVRYDTDKHGNVISGQSLVMIVSRLEGTETAQVTLKLSVAGVAAFGGKTPLAYLHRNLLNEIENYQSGRQVDAYGWPGFARSAPVSYTEYLMFTKELVSPLDLMKLKAHGLTARRLSPQDPNDESRQSLAGCLHPHSLVVHSLYAEGASGTKRLTRAPEDIEAVTDVDDVIVAWSPPLELAASHTTLIGLTVRKRWLKSAFLHPDLPFVNEQETLVLRPLDGSLAQTGHWDLPLPGATVTLAVDTNLPNNAAIPTTNAQPPLARAFQTLQQQLPKWFGTPPSTGSGSVTVTALKPVWPLPFKGVIPAALLSHLHAAERGEVEFDQSSQLFIVSARDNAYFQARVIAADIYAVPAVDDFLTREGFATQSQRVRVEELQGYARTLKLLVYVVGAISAFFGLWTLTTAFWQESERKKRFIAELLALGARPLTIAYVVLVRGLLIGMVAAGVTILLANVLARLLTEHIAECIVLPEHLKVIAVAAFVAGGIGSLLPAIRVSLIEPSEAIREGANS